MPGNAHPPSRAVGIVSQIGAVGAAVVGFTVLVGWLLGVDRLKSLNPAWVTMKPNTAVGFVLLGAALWLASAAATVRWRRIAAVILAGCVALMTSLTLVEFITDLDLHLDELLFQEDAQAVNTTHAGRMALRTTLLFLAVALGLLVRLVPSRGSWRLWLQQLTAMSVLLCAQAGVLLYLFGAEPATGQVDYTPIAYHTAVCFVLLGVSLLLLLPTAGPGRIFAQRTLGGLVARWAVPCALLLPMLIGYLRYLGELHRQYDHTSGAIYSTILYASLLAGILLVLAHVIGRAEFRQHAAEETRERFFTLSQDMMCIAGFDGYFKRVNHAFEQVTGYTADELTSRPYLDFVHPDDREQTVAEAAKYSAATPTLAFINRYICKDGRVKTISWSATPVPESQLIYATARDVTEDLRNRAQILQLSAEKAERLRALELAHRELEAFSYSVSHDLRGPLRHISGYTEMLDEDLGPNKPVGIRRHLDNIYRSSRNMDRLIDELLAFARMARAELAAVPCDMQMIFSQVKASLEPRYTGRPIDWRVGELPRVVGDPALLRQIWVNLIDNALKYSRTRERSQVTITANREADRVIFSVADNGVGFDPKFAHKLFGVFQRLHSVQEFEGTGIGLANVRRIAERHGGTAWAEGRLNAGATVYFSLPYASARAEPATEAKASSSSAALADSVQA